MARLQYVVKLHCLILSVDHNWILRDKDCLQRYYIFFYDLKLCFLPVFFLCFSNKCCISKGKSNVKWPPVAFLHRKYFTTWSTFNSKTLHLHSLVTRAVLHFWKMHYLFVTWSQFCKLFDTKEGLYLTN